MSGKRCRVSFIDLRGSKHTVTVGAESLYEAAAAALVEFRKSAWPETQPGPMTQLEVEVAEPTTRHSVTAQQVQRWAQKYSGHAGRPGEARARASAAPHQMIIRRLGSVLQLITQPDHAAQSARIMRRWHPDHFPDGARKPSFLRAIEEHDAGWAEIDDALVVDDATGQLVDFIGVSDALKRETSWRGIEGLTDDPYAAALVAQHRLHVYGRYAEHPEWQAFFADVTTARDTNLRAAGSDSLEDLLRDYQYVRLGDLASLAFCNNWTRTEEYGYAMVLEGTSLVVTPDPLNGRTIEIDIEAREIEEQSFASAADARRVIADTRVVRITGRLSGSA